MDNLIESDKSTNSAYSEIMVDEENIKEEIKTNDNKEEENFLYRQPTATDLGVRKSKLDDCWKFIFNRLLAHRKLIKQTFAVVFHIITIIFVYCATYTFILSDQNEEESKRYGLFILCLIILYTCTLYHYKPRFFTKPLRTIKEAWRNTKIVKSFKKHCWLRWVFYLTVIILLCIFTMFLHGDEFLDSLRALIGFWMFILFCCLYSAHTARIQARPVFSGIILAFIFGILAHRFAPVRYTVKIFGELLTNFTRLSVKLAKKFVFGKKLGGRGVYVFAVDMTCSIFFMALVKEVIYYYRFNICIVNALGYIFKCVMGTSLTESAATSANFFLSSPQVAIFLKDYIQDLTASEYHAIMSAGYSSMDSSLYHGVIGFTRYGVHSSHLLIAAFVSAPVNLFVSKLIWPETRKTKAIPIHDKNAKYYYDNVVEAIVNGVYQTIPVYILVLGCTIVWVCIAYNVDQVFNWAVSLVGVQSYKFNNFGTTIFKPIVYMMGISWKESGSAGLLLFLKFTRDEFVAYEKLCSFANDRTISDRTTAIMICALCGFHNFAAVGGMVSSLWILCPNSRETVLSSVKKAALSGLIVNLLCGCICGMLVNEQVLAKTLLVERFENRTQRILYDFPSVYVLNLFP